MKFKLYFKELIEKSETLGEKCFDILIQTLIIITVISFSISTLPNLSDFTRNILYYLNIFIVTIFSVEYFLRIYTSDNKKKYILSFFGIIDLIAILPFYISLGLQIYDISFFDFTVIRIFRLLRLLRILKLVRYSIAVQRFHRAFNIAKEEIVLFIFVALFMIYLSSVGIYFFENQAQPENFKSVIHSLWWSVATLTTVGYGDVYPITHGGKLFTFFILLIGLGLIAVPSGLIATALTKARELEENEDSQI